AEPPLAGASPPSPGTAGPCHASCCFSRSRRPNDPGQDKVCAGKRNAVSPQAVLRTIRMRVFQPFADLLFRLGLLRPGDNLSVCLKHICPETDLLIGRILRSKVGTPPIRKALEPCALGRGQAADNI